MGGCGAFRMRCIGLDRNCDFFATFLYNFIDIWVFLIGHIRFTFATAEIAATLATAQTTTTASEAATRQDGQCPKYILNPWP
jgi:hypothetical protein